MDDWTYLTVCRACGEYDGTMMIDPCCSFPDLFQIQGPGPVDPDRIPGLAAGYFLTQHMTRVHAVRLIGRVDVDKAARWSMSSRAAITVIRFLTWWERFEPRKHLGAVIDLDADSDSDWPKLIVGDTRVSADVPLITMRGWWG